MTRYLISFDDGAMTIPEEELPDVAAAAHKVVYEAKDSGVWIFGGGMARQSASIVATDGTVTNGPYPETKAVIGGFAIIDVPSPEEALEWAAKFAVAKNEGVGGVFLWMYGDEAPGTWSLLHRYLPLAGQPAASPTGRS